MCFFPVHPNISIVIFHAHIYAFPFGTDKENLPNSQSILSQKQHRVKNWGSKTRTTCNLVTD